MAYRPHVDIDLTDARRLLVGGDVHGHLPRLIASLETVGYDADAGDRLILLGDLLDRGPEVLAIHEWLRANPTVVVLTGNHDEMLMASLGLRPMDKWSNPVNLLRNGGDWLTQFALDEENRDFGTLMVALIQAEDGTQHELIDPRVVAFARDMLDFPVAATVTTPWGRRVALVHADVPRATWAETVEGLMSPSASEAHGTRIACTWERRLFNRMENAMGHGPEALAQLPIGIPDVDHVFLGHSIVAEPTTAANLTWIDTGPYRGGPISVVDVDAWLDRIESSNDKDPA